ncbi:MAG: 2OG-Fe(II) oxygenase family protein [Kiloniellales bacterium]|nr:2OG-Fe(II) oxygenase family protein [Kiloniellales bacterium]
MSQKLFDKAELVQLFPTCVWVHEVSDHAALNARLMSRIETLEREAPENVTPQNAWQSQENLHLVPGFEDFARLITAATRNILGFLKCRFDELYITSCWANLNRKGYAHHDHTHPNNVLSGVYYVKTPKHSGGIVFSDPRPQAHVLAPSVTERNLFNANIQRFEPREGTMLVFPSWLEHAVEANHSDEVRVSIAFNVMIHGSVGQDKAWAQI